MHFINIYFNLTLQSQQQQKRVYSQITSKTNKGNRPVVHGDKSRLSLHTFIFQIYVISVRRQNKMRQHSSTNQVTLGYIVLLVRHLKVF